MWRAFPTDGLKYWKSCGEAAAENPLVVYFSFGCAVVIYYALCFRYGIDLDDEGLLLGGAADVLDGKFPLADFYSYQPWMYFSLAGFFRLFGTTLLTERAFLILYLLAAALTLLWLSRRLLPPLLAFVPAGLYTIAPGPWYKVFFIFHLLVVLAALTLFDARPRLPWALLAGLAAGFALVSRSEVAGIAVVLFVGTVGAILISDMRFRPALWRRTIMLQIANAGVYVFGLCLPVGVFGAVYYSAGKLGRLIEQLRYYATPDLYSNVIDLTGRADSLSLSGLFTQPSLAHWFYALSLLACLALFLINFVIFFRVDSERSTQARRYSILGAAAIASMGYTFFFVWNSRMLSSFAIVYLAEVVLFYQLSAYLRAQYRLPFMIVGMASMLFVVHAFSAVNFYSGSVRMRVLTPGYSQNPFLKGAVIDASQVESIDELTKYAAADPGATLVPMSEATTMGFLSGLENPTYYRLFTVELFGKARQERAIETFEQFKIKYFVARSGQFIAGGAPASNLAAYAPMVKAYLLAHYDVRKLGENYVILIRRPASLSHHGTAGGAG